MAGTESANEVGAQIERSESVSHWCLHAARRIKFSETVRSVLTAASILLTREHHAAMVDLAKARHFASLLALTRSVYEASIWAIWTSRIATDEELLLLAKNRLTRGLEKMVRGLDGAQFFECPMLKDMKPVIERMDGFVHGGFQHLQYRIHKERVEAEYPDELIVSALQIADVFAVMAILEGPALEADIELGNQLFEESAQLLAKVA